MSRFLRLTYLPHERRRKNAPNFRESVHFSHHNPDNILTARVLQQFNLTKAAKFRIYVHPACLWVCASDTRYLPQGYIVNM